MQKKYFLIQPAVNKKNSRLVVMKKISVKIKVFFYLFLILAIKSGAQEPDVKRNAFRGTRLVNAQSANLAENGELLLLIQHRFGDISGGFYELFGLDQASMRLGFEYGLAKNLNLGIGRSSFMKTYDGMAKLRLAQQTSEFPLSVVATASGSLPTLSDVFPANYDNISGKFSGHAQLLLAKTVGNFSLQVSPGLMNTGYFLFENKKHSFFTLGLGGSARVSGKMSLNLEYLHRFENDISKPKTFSAGVDIDTGGHLFQLMVSNGQQMFDQAFFTNSSGDWAKGKLFFGFNLIREFKLKYD